MTPLKVILLRRDPATPIEDVAVTLLFTLPVGLLWMTLFAGKLAALPVALLDTAVSAPFPGLSRRIAVPAKKSIEKKNRRIDGIINSSSMKRNLRSVTNQMKHFITDV